MKRIIHYAAFIISIAVGQPASAAIVPVYQVTGGDATWTHAGEGVYTVPTSAEDYDNEIWERPVKDNEWIDADGTRTSNKVYYGYGDLEYGAWGVGAIDNGEGDPDNGDYLFIRWDVVGAFEHEVGKDAEDKLLEANYYFYAELPEDTGFAVKTVGKDLGSDYGVSGDVFVYTENVETDVPVDETDITNTGQGGNSYGNETAAGEGRTDNTAIGVGSVVEVAILLSDLGYTLSDFINNPLDYVYIGVAVSNPSAPDTDLFANDHFSSAKGEGVEYDTMKLGEVVIPIPAAVWLFGSALAGLGFAGSRRRKRRLV